MTSRDGDGFWRWISHPFRLMRVSLVGNAFFLMLNSGIGAALGMAFWLLAARFYSTSDVGFAAALIPVTALLAQLASLGLGPGLIRFLPATLGDTNHSVGLVNTSMTLTALSAMGIATVFAFGVDLWAPSLVFIRTNPLFLLAFIAFTATFSITLIIDHVFMACRQAKYVLVRNTVFATLRTPLPLAFAGLFGIFGLYLSHSLAIIAASVLALFSLVPRLLRNYRAYPLLKFGLLKPLFTFSLGNYTATLLGSFLTGALPLLVIRLLSSEANASFYISWFLGSMLHVIPAAFTTSLFAEGSHLEGKVPRDARRALLSGAVLLLPAGLILFFLGDWFLGVFGPQYLSGFPLLRWLVLASPFVLVNGVYLAIIKVRKRVWPLVLASGWITSGTFALGYFLLPLYGLGGIGIAYLVAHSTTTIAILSRHVFRRAMFRQPNPC